MDGPTSAMSADRYARLAGFLFLFYIVTSLSGSVLMSSFHIAGDVAQTAANVQASELLYRISLIMQLAGNMSAIPLGWSLYVLLKPLNPPLALIALLWRVGESVIGAVAVVFMFLALRVFTGATNSDAAAHQMLATLVINVPRAAFPITVTYFAIGSLLFFWLLARSPLLPRALSLLGVWGSLCAIVLGLGMMLFPAQGTLLQLLWIPLLIAEVGGGLWLLNRGAGRASKITDKQA